MIIFSFLQTLLRELEFKKPQLDELVNTAESLKTDANKLQLQTKGRKSFRLFTLFWGKIIGCLQQAQELLPLKLFSMVKMVNLIIKFWNVRRNESFCCELAESLMMRRIKKIWRFERMKVFIRNGKILREKWNIWKIKVDSSFLIWFENGFILFL